MKTDPKNFLKLTRVLPLMAILLTPVIAIAQAEDAEDQVFELSAFEVTATNDRGYISTNTTSGTSLNMQIRDLPMGLEVINQELIEDLGATDMREALSYSAGVFMDSFENTSSANSEFRTNEKSPSSVVNVGGAFNNSISIRGYAVPNQQRMGFRVGAIVPEYGVVLGGTTDSANTERQEVVRGPQSLLYGINVLSGIVNIMPKKPLGEQRTWVSLSIGSDDFQRMTLDHTGPLIKDKLNYRIMATNLQKGDWTQYKNDKRQYYVGQFEWFITKKLKLFVEGQYRKSVREGGGPKYFVDAGGEIDEFRNDYDERYTYGLDYFNEEKIDDEEFIGVEDDYGPVYGRNWLVQQEGKEYSFPNLGHGFRISGPDVRREEKEYNLLALGTYSPFRNLDIEAGVYYTNTDIYTRNVDLDVGNGSGPFIATVDGFRGYKYNPELAPYWDSDTNKPRLSQTEWSKGYGLGEMISAEDDFRPAPFMEVERRYAWYSWYEKPTTSESMQARLRVAYQFETHGLNGWLDAKHTLSGGVNNIKDTVDFVRGGVSPDTTYSAGTSDKNYTDNNLANDPFYLRTSIFDYSPVRFSEDTVLAIPGRVNYANLGDITINSGAHFARSGWSKADLWYKGIYGVYHGQFWNNRMNLIGGIRRDAYQVKEYEQLRVIDRDMVTDRWQGGVTSKLVTDIMLGYGNKPYTWREDLPDSLNQQLEEEFTLLRETQPDGTVEYNFDEDQKYTTGTFGLSYRLRDDISMYYLYSEGIFPNSGQRDGQYNPIPAEQTSSSELGLKFDLMDGKISGTISAFRIKRENAVWYWKDAPNPGKWSGGPDSPFDPIEDAALRFSPQAVEEDIIEMRMGVWDEYVEEAFANLGMEPPAKIRGQYFPFQFEEWGVEAMGTTPTPDPSVEFISMFWVNLEKMMAVEGPNPIKEMLNLAVRDKEAYLPIDTWYGAGGATTLAYNASSDSNRGANVLFEEEGLGIDGQLIFSPISNYQIMFSFSHQKREVTGGGFILAPGYAIDQDGNQVDDKIWTTAWEEWVWILGPENFADDGEDGFIDPSTLKKGSISGIDLSFVPKWSFRLWNKYQFIEGPLEGFEVGGGIRGNASVPTTVPIGGPTLSSNLYPTPDVPERYAVDLFLSYKTRLFGYQWRVALNVNNLFTNDIGEATAIYPVEGADPEYRRTRVFYTPTSYRLSLTATF